MPNWGYFQTIRIYDFRILRIADTSRNLITVILQSSIIYLTIVTSYHTNLTIYSPHLFTSYHYSLHITLFSYYIIRYVIHYPVIHYIHYPLPSLPSLHTLSFTYHIPPFFSCPTTQLSYLLFIFSLFISSPFSYPYIPLYHFLVTSSPITITITFAINVHYRYNLSHISPTYLNLNILYITHMRDNISPYLSQTIFTPL